MKIICYKCEKIIDKDKYVNGKLVEEYKNVYGTYCPNCGSLIEPIEKVTVNKDKELKMEMLKEEMREKLRKKIQGEKKCL